MAPVKSLTLFIFLLLTAVSSPCRASEPSVLEILDQKIASPLQFSEGKVEEIARCKAQYESASDDAARYDALRGLYQVYSSFRVDSALIVASKRLETARRIGNPSKIVSASLNLAEGYAKSGLPDEALAILDTLNGRKGGEGLEEYQRKYRDSILHTAYTLKSESAILPADRMAAHEKLRELRDRILSRASRDSKGYYTLTAEKLVDAGLYPEAVAVIEEGDRKFDFSDNAALQYKMGEIYMAAGLREKAIEKLANSSILDITSGVKEYQSLILLASLLFEQGDVERAFRYINRAFEDAEFSKAKLRTPEIMKVMPVINTTFRTYEQENARRTRVFLLITGIMVVLLLLAGVALWRMLRANRAMLARIEEINARLEQRNTQLMEADALKLSHINTLLLNNAAYISRLKDFRKGVYRLMKTGQYDKALDILKSDQADAKDIAAFHEMFDVSFLAMFPNFVERVNRLFKTPVELKNDSRLTPELRVIALMRLGITSTNEIAGMLHYSPQTVYNLRTTIRSLTDLPKEEFEAKIKEI